MKKENGNKLTDKQIIALLRMAGKIVFCFGFIIVWKTFWIALMVIFMDGTPPNFWPFWSCAISFVITSILFFGPFYLAKGIKEWWNYEIKK